jgi:flagellar L-ring protein FlgH
MFFVDSLDCRFVFRGLQAPSMSEMMRNRRGSMSLQCRSAVAGAIATICLAVATSQVLGQDASLLQAPQAAAPGQPPLTLENSSYIYQKIPAEAELHELRVNDIITVLVDYRSTMASDGNAENRKTASLNAALKDWLHFDGKNLFPDPQSQGDPKIDGELTSQYRTDGQLQFKDSLTFRIAATVVDIQPNGNLVIEGHRNITIDDEVWRQSLTGVVRRQSIGPDRTVRSDEIADLRVDKKSMGFVRDSTARGWFAEWYDKWKPF